MFFGWHAQQLSHSLKWSKVIEKCYISCTEQVFKKKRRLASCIVTLYPYSNDKSIRTIEFFRSTWAKDWDFLGFRTFSLVLLASMNSLAGPIQIISWSQYSIVFCHDKIRADGVYCFTRWIFLLLTLKYGQKTVTSLIRRVFGSLSDQVITWQNVRQTSILLMPAFDLTRFSEYVQFSPPSLHDDDVCCKPLDWPCQMCMNYSVCVHF